MISKTILVFVFCLFSRMLYADILPTENETLTSLRLPFSVEPKENAGTYVFKIALGMCDTKSQLEAIKIIEERSGYNHIILTLPFFNKEYSWLVEYYDSKGEMLGTSAINYFKTAAPADRDSTKFRFKVIKNEYPDKSLLLFVDCGGGLFDLTGKPLWFVPQIVHSPGTDINAITNLMLSPSGTITYLLGSAAYEINYRGDVLWQAPESREDGSPNRFHHDFIKLSDGNYMLLNWETIKRKIPDALIDGLVPDPLVTKTETGYYKKVDLGMIEKYDREGNRIWEWKSADYITDEDLFTRKVNDGRYKSVTHLNAFYYDETQKSVYAGFRDLSRIVKISYPGNEKLSEYNGVIKMSGHRLFAKQHSISMTADNELLVFSNNISKPLNTPMQALDDDDKLGLEVSSIVQLNENAIEQGLGKSWEFFCDIDEYASPAGYRGGSVVELADGNLLICMGASGRILIVSKAGGVLYNAVPEQWNEHEQKWEVQPQYRVSPVFMESLNKAILAQGL